jgi:glutamine phosphoribosylpyrophosphate amidotransferase
MCAIFASCDKKQVAYLSDLNRNRGTSSYSISCFREMAGKFTLFKTFKDLGEFPKDLNYLPTADYYICHVQAPTSGAVALNQIHPAQFSDFVLWHNGIINHNSLTNYAQYPSIRWDTALLVSHIKTAISIGGSLAEVLEWVEGSFACVLLDGNGEIKIFRNALCPLYIDKDLNLSSVEFSNSNSVKDTCIYAIDPLKKSIKQIGTFKSRDSVYYMQE